MSFFISVYLIIGVFEKCQNILFLLLKRREIQDFHRFGIPSYFSFPKLSFIEYHTIISEVCFYNREFHSLIFGIILGVILSIMGIHCDIVNLLYIIYKSYVLGVIFGVIFNILGVILASCVISLTLSIILCLLGVILNFLSTFLLFCPLFCLLFRFNVYYLHNLEYHFHCFGVHFRVHFGVHSKFWGSYYRTCYY